jgi:serine/threonine protein kinase
LDGKLRIRVPPRTVDRDRISVMYTDKTVSSINLNVIEIVSSSYGESLVALFGHKFGLTYVMANGTAKYISTDTLAEILVECGGKLLRGLGNKLSVCTPEWASKSLIDSQSQDMALNDNVGLKTTSLFPQDAFQWMIDYSDLIQTQVIGEGAFGKVYLGKWHETDVAIKALTSLGALGIAAGKVASYATEADVKDALKTLEREVGLMVGMRHPNVILFLGVCPDPPCVVTEYCSRGSLYDVLREAKENQMVARSLTWYRRVSMMLDAAKGMLYLHSHKPTIIHRDLKSPNLLVDGNWTVKVTDFNLSRLADVAAQPGVQSSVVANNPRWHAPEIIRDALFTKSGDVYAFGLIMWEMISWELPFDGMSAFQMILLIGDKAGRPTVPSSDQVDEIRGGVFPGYNSYVELMVRCWDQNPEKRPEFPEIISSLRDILSTFPEDPTSQSSNADTSQIFTESERHSSLEDAPKEPTQEAVQNTMVPTPAITPVQNVNSPFDLPASSAPDNPISTNGYHASPFDGAPSPFDAPVTVMPTVRSPFDTNDDGPTTSNNIDARPSRSTRNMVIDSVSETRRGKLQTSPRRDE